MECDCVNAGETLKKRTLSESLLCRVYNLDLIHHRNMYCLKCFDDELRLGLVSIAIIKEMSLFKIIGRRPKKIATKQK